jgi:hypothetical protein
MDTIKYAEKKLLEIWEYEVLIRGFIPPFITAPASSLKNKPYGGKRFVGSGCLIKMPLFDFLVLRYNPLQHK